MFTTQVLLLLTILHSLHAHHSISPSDCDPIHGCGAAIAAAINACKQADFATSSPSSLSTSTSCEIMLQAGARYRVSCPAYTGPYAYIFTPGAVDLSNTTNITFGAPDIGAPAHLDVDYINNGCPAIAAHHARNMRIQNLVIDCQRLPFSRGTVAKVNADGTEVKLAMEEPGRSEYDIMKYPWFVLYLHTCMIMLTTYTTTCILFY